MGKLKEITGYVRMILDKLSDIRADLVRIEDDWQEWDFGQFIEALKHQGNGQIEINIFR